MVKIKIKLNSETVVEFVKLMNSLPYDINLYDGIRLNEMSGVLKMM